MSNTKQYVKVDDDTYLEYDPVSKSSRVIVKSRYIKQKEELEQRLEELGEVTEEDIMAWAMEHYPEIDKVREKTECENILVTITSVLDQLK